MRLWLLLSPFCTIRPTQLKATDRFDFLAPKTEGDIERAQGEKKRVRQRERERKRERTPYIHNEGIERERETDFFLTTLKPIFVSVAAIHQKRKPK